ncbi:DUF6443 domain-containing protein [Flavobacterium chungangensis]|uniref:DUF6443 domain-containing protein n=1 Tax=Flavobacterium chungangensis TaxID=2708132 RepID=A0ABV8ZE98_9FLAO
MKKIIQLILLFLISAFSSYAQDTIPAIKKSISAPVMAPAAIKDPPCDDCPLGYDWNRDLDNDGYGDPNYHVYSWTKPSGYVANQADCNDRDSTINPDTVWYRDADGDGFGTSALTIKQCLQPAGYVRNALDLNDSTPYITNITPQYFYQDADGDGYGNPNVYVYYSFQPGGYVANNWDCYDSDASLNPNTVWYRDADGDGYGNGGVAVNSCTQPGGYVRNAADYNDSTGNITNVAPQYFYQDADGDGYGNHNIYVYYSYQPGGYVTNYLDCNDNDPSLNPTTIWYRDADADGYGNGNVTARSCNQPDGYVRNAADYDDNTGNITNIAPQYFYRDADGDGYGNPNVYVYYSYQPGGYVANNLDCNDSDGSLNPNTVWYRDADGDTFGNGGLTVNSCTQPGGYVRNAADYDDSTGNITNVAPQYFYRDADGDGYGNPNVYVYYSYQPGGYVANNGDCYDSDSSLNPNTVWYRDADGDGFGNANLTVQSCTQPGGYVRNAADYDDSTGNITNVAPQYFYYDSDSDGYGNPNVYVYYSYQPGGYVTNNLDCNDSDASLNPNTVWYRDADGDTFGTSTLTVKQCLKPEGYVRNAADIDDSTANITNIQPQYFYRDADGDGYGNSNVYVIYSYQPGGYVTNNWDCNDSDTSLNPYTKWYADSDLDGLGDPSVFVQQCTAPNGNYVRNNSDNCPSLAGSSSDCSDILIPSADRNYIISKVYKKPKKAIVESPALDEVQTNITYFDGLGRAIQQIANRQSFTGKDIITHITYDSIGRQVQEFLPYEASSTDMSYATDAKDATNAFYNTEKYENTSNPFSQKKLEPSPLSRILRQAAPGNPWAMDSSHEIKFDYGANAADEVKLYKASAAWNAGSGLYDISLSDSGYYEPKELFKNITYDENTSASPAERSGSTVEFKNKEGQIVLKRTYDAGEKHDTYYVYDIYGNLTYVIPPKAEGSINQDILNGLCYQYKYDNKNRLAEKKLPGKQWEFIVYDKLDRAVATGPAFSPFKDENVEGWIITKYDAFGRPIYTGWSNQASNTATRKSLQDAQNNATVVFESRQTSGSIDGIEAHYSNVLAPTSFKLLTVNYYDGYAFPNAQPLPSTIEEQLVLTNVKTLATGSWTRAITTASSTAGETSTIFYDDKARPIKNYLQNHLGGYTSSESKIDFAGKTLYTITKHKRTSGDAEIVVREEFTYSPQDRLLTHTHQINGGTVELLTYNSYDALGQLESKKVGSSVGSPLQKVDFQYNIRGWLKEINKTSNLQQDTDPADLFAFKINYETTQTDISDVKALYNGNISETFWKTASDLNERAYGYKYDNLNRLTNAVYEKNGLTTSAYDENLSYDKNGNIKTLSRKGDYDPQLGNLDIDDLVYTYPANSNQLSKVADNSNNSSGFNDVNKTDDDYSYDDNGNMIADKNKNITSITYNHLNLPKKITFGTTGSIEYFYNASGQKLEKQVTEGTVTAVTNYLGGYQYKDNVLEFFPTAEGYVKNTAGALSYVFQYKDHLGNVRVSYAKNPTTQVLEIIEENNYYPFGLKHKGYNDYLPTANKYKFQGQELQDELGLGWYSYKWRNYDPAIGRFMSVDPLTEKYEDYTPYQFSSNQPVHAKELEGLESSNDLNKQTPTQRAYNPKTGNTDLVKLVVYATADFLESINTYVREQEEPSNKEITTTATSKKGGGENEKSTGKKVGDNISADAFLDGAPGAAKNGNNLKSNKDIMKGAADLGKLSSKVDKAIKSVKDVIKENSGKGNSPSDMVQVVTDAKDPNKNVQVRRDVLEAQEKKK